MAALAELADRARACLEGGRADELAPLMLENFQWRRQMYSDGVVGEANLQAAALADSLGLAAKFTGSGGAFVCLRADSPAWYVHWANSLSVC